MVTEVTGGRRKLFRDISANSIQTAFTHGLGILIFYLTSKYLQKDEFGEFNWCLAVGSTIVAVASLGLDLVFVRKVASGADAIEIAGMHLFHTMVSGIVLLLTVLTFSHFSFSFRNIHPLFVFIFLHLVVANIANSFKLCLNGLEAYRHLATINVIANSIKFLAILVLAFNDALSLINVVCIYAGVSLVELISGYVLLRVYNSLRVRPRFKPVDYKYFIMESLPQLGVVIFDSALARIDWILLGLLGTAAVTAEYSFAYKVHEMSRLPLIVIAPILLTRFSKLFARDNVINEEQEKNIRTLFRFQMFVMMIIPVVLVATWAPLVSYFTGGKYGASNEPAFRLLSVCVPMLSIINFIWTFMFASGELKKIMYITLSVSVLNIAANLALIPLYGGNGAAAAFLFSTLVQLLLYFWVVRKEKMRPGFGTYAGAIGSAVAAIAAAGFFANSVIFAAVISLTVYTLFSLLTGQLRIKELRNTFRGSGQKESQDS